MSLKYRNKETGEVVVVKDVQPSLMALSSLKELLDESIPIPSARLIVKYWELPLQSPLEIHSVFREDFLRTHEPVTPPCPVCQEKEGQIAAHAFSKRRILEILQEHERQAMIGSSRSLSFSEIAQKTGIREKFVIRMCVEMDEAGQVSIRDLDRCFVMRME